MNARLKAGFHGMLISVMLGGPVQAISAAQPALGVACPTQSSAEAWTCSSNRLKEAGFQLIWSGTVDGERVRKWYSADRDVTVISVQDAEGQSGTVGEYTIPGQVHNGELIGTGEMPAPTNLNALQVEMRAYSVDEASAPALQDVQQALFSTLTRRGFRHLWTRHADSDGYTQTYEAWYQPDLDMSVLCIHLTSAAASSQTVLAMQGRLRSNEYMPAF